MHAVPALLITGIHSAAKAAFLRALLTARPSQQRWALLDNDGGHLASAFAGPQVAVAAAGGCACCTGQVALQTGVVRLLRESRPQRLVIVAAAAAEPAALARTLQQQDLARALRMTAHLCIAAPGMQAGGSAAHELWLRQMRAADHVVAVDNAAITELQGLAEHIIGIDAAVVLALGGASEAPRAPDSGTQSSTSG